jgi:uncharacterized protein YkwD
MKKTKISLAFITTLSALALFAQNGAQAQRRPVGQIPQATLANPVPAATKSTCMTPEEAKLVDAINTYRRSKGLPALQPGVSLTRIAQVHAADLTQNQPARGTCNMHSWSSKGN